MAFPKTTYEHLLTGVLKTPVSAIAATHKLLLRALDIAVTCVVILSLVMGRPSKTGPITELKSLHQKLSGSIGFIPTSSMLLILQFGVMGMVPAPAASPEMAMLVPIVIGFLLVLQFLLLGLLHVGASNAVSNELAKLPDRVETSFSACDPCGAYEVDPLPPRFLA